MGERPVVIVSDAAEYVGPALARLLASTHDLVLGEPADDLVAAARDSGSEVAVVRGRRDLAVAGATEELVDTALDRFGRLDAAVAFTGAIGVGRFRRSDVDDLRKALVGCVEAPYRFLRGVVPPMLEHGGGQVLIFTSAAGARPTPGAPLYSSARAAANMLVRNVALEVADRNVQVNAIGTNFMDFPGFLRANRAEDPEGRARVEATVPMRRLGSMDELAHMALPFIDGTSRFTTGQFVAVAGGWA
jgi:3-oxoacyl-[acyl-carrier protein] reductase